jgi:hypothetical protein
MTYNACTTAGIQKKSNKTQFSSKAPPQPSSKPTAKGGSKKARIAKQILARVFSFLPVPFLVSVLVVVMFQ